MIQLPGGPLVSSTGLFASSVETRFHHCSDLDLPFDPRDVADVNSAFQ